MTDSELQVLMGAYFHQDFDLEHGDDRGAVRAYLADGPESAARLVADIDAALAAHGTSEALGAYLIALGCNFYPPAVGLDYRTWLTSVRDQVAATLIGTTDTG